MHTTNYLDTFIEVAEDCPVAVAQEPLAAARDDFFAGGQPCLRSSPLAKRYGWGIHSYAAGRVALVPLGSADYERVRDSAAATTRAMRSARRR